MSLFGFDLGHSGRRRIGFGGPFPEPLPLPDLAARVEPSVVEVLGKIEGSGRFLLRNRLHPSRTLLGRDQHPWSGSQRTPGAHKRGALLASVKVLETDERRIWLCCE